MRWTKRSKEDAISVRLLDLKILKTSIVKIRSRYGSEKWSLSQRLAVANHTPPIFPSPKDSNYLRTTESLEDYVYPIDDSLLLSLFGRAEPLPGEIVTLSPA